MASNGQKTKQAQKRVEDAMEKIHQSNKLLEVQRIDRNELGPAIKALLAAKLKLLQESKPEKSAKKSKTLSDLNDRLLK